MARHTALQIVPLMPSMPGERLLFNLATQAPTSETSRAGGNSSAEAIGASDSATGKKLRRRTRAQSLQLVTSSPFTRRHPIDGEESVGREKKALNY